MHSQEKLPYSQISTASTTHTPVTVATRMTDGLGFRYYWATENLKPQDLTFKPSEEATTTLETIDHILSLSNVILNSLLQLPNTSEKLTTITFQQKRKLTLQNLEQASAILQVSKHVFVYKMIFQRGENTTEFPFWNMVNDPISDAIWRVGQVVSFRRSSGNLLPKDVNVLTGKKKN